MDSINRVILATGEIVFVTHVVRDADGVPVQVQVPTGRTYRDEEVAFYLEVGQDVTVGVLMEALGPDWVVC